MRLAVTALALIAASPLAARADEEGESGAILESLIPSPTLAQRYDPDDYPPRGYRRSRRQPAAREGLLISFGLGGGSLWVSSPGFGPRTGAFDFDFRLGWGFSDRFQMFMDFDGVGGTNSNGDDVGSWTWTIRGQTVLVGDRAGNGLNVNFGVGFGGVTYNAGYYDRSASPTGLALAGGISYDARLSPWFSLSPEFFLTWHQVPNGSNYSDVATIYGLRINFLWYLH